MFIIFCIRETRGMRAEAARSERLVREGVDVEWRVEIRREFGEVGVESVDVIFDCDEVILGIVEFVEAGIVDEVVKMSGRDFKNLVSVVAGRNSGNECDR